MSNANCYATPGMDFATFQPIAREIVRDCATRYPTFNADDVRFHASMRLVTPRHLNYWGAIFADMSASGEITKHGGTLNSRRADAKARLLQGWRGVACLTTRERARNALRRFFSRR